MLQGREVIKSLTLLPNELLGDTEEDRRSVFDRSKTIIREIKQIAQRSAQRSRPRVLWQNPKNPAQQS